MKRNKDAPNDGTEGGYGALGDLSMSIECPEVPGSTSSDPA